MNTNWKTKLYITIADTARYGLKKDAEYLAAKLNGTLIFDEGRYPCSDVCKITCDVIFAPGTTITYSYLLAPPIFESWEITIQRIRSHLLANILDCVRREIEGKLGWSRD